MTVSPDSAEYIRSPEALLAALEDANSLCRSAYQIASRDGAETNWEAFRNRLGDSLAYVQRPLLTPGASEFTPAPRDSDHPAVVTARTFRAAGDASPVASEPEAPVHALADAWSLVLPNEDETFSDRLNVFAEMYTVYDETLTLTFGVPADPNFHPYILATRVRRVESGDGKPYPFAIDQLGPDGVTRSRFVFFTNALVNFTTAGTSYGDGAGESMPQRVTLAFKICGCCFDIEPPATIDLARYRKAAA